MRQQAPRNRSQRWAHTSVEQGQAHRPGQLQRHQHKLRGSKCKQRQRVERQAKKLTTPRTLSLASRCMSLRVSACFLYPARVAVVRQLGHI